METHKKQQGYALIFVLLLIIFIMILSTVFMRGAIGNMKQEKIVDKSNLAFVVAEMGMDYYLQKIWNAERVVFNDIKKKTEPKLDLYITCSKTPNCTQSKSINEINNEAKLEYKKSLGNEITAIKNSATKRDDININDKSITFELIELNTVNEVENKNQVGVNLEIKGTSSTEMKKSLRANITFTLDDFILQDQSTPKGLITKSKEMYDYFLNEKDFKKNIIPCSSNGKCIAGNYYTNGLINTKNPNQLIGLIWIHDGMLNAGNNMNNMDSILIVKSLKIENNMNNLNGSLILMGGNDRSGSIESNIEIGFKSNGKVCINIDGYRKEDIEKIKFSSINKERVLFYSSAINPVWPTNATSSPKYSGSLVNFLNVCTGLNIKEGTNTTDPYITPYLFGSLTDVNYH
ncbi:hypothetical protein [Sporosarcina sp. JAI121]|uniref:hypothetical protein n=1 Tax=Sporosarcina sp. JAI121 TaxID=2723064 RepID=UPI0015C78EC2|nr:hypothetical protein [Sporosarcina sp. JAI121]NYF25030.1 Tfp pilus assembly protein PilX [Sporosarcina sp. JAI121]